MSGEHDDKNTPFPHDLDAFYSTVASILMERGKLTALAVLAYGTATPTPSWEHDNWDGGTWTCNWLFEARIARDVFARLEENQREQAASDLVDVSREVLGASTEHHVWQWRILPTIEKVEGWQAQARAVLEGRGGVHNQGRVRSDNPAMLEYDGLFFRSPPEKWFYAACKEAKLVCAPLPVFLRPGDTRPFRIEPDMLVLREGRVVQFELDGSSFHRESPLEAQERVKAMTREGVEVHRLAAADCATLDKARAALRRAFAELKLSMPSGT